ncbi:hypothetical protein [Arthrobacter sp. UCD-GKA]|uniref:hypothetical protein n=1 Tax=Arthrobacter sp. UCD-GKA TaxID=1913576 RepID=UPI0011132E94|nr:hypothetical protein [Arthrobacter sp. UCD-GKA]
MTSNQDNIKQRRKRWKQLRAEATSTQHRVHPITAWLWTSLLGLVFAVSLFLVTGTFVFHQSENPADTVDRIAEQLHLTSDNAIGLLALLATIVVALAFSRDRFDPNALDSTSLALQRIRSAGVATALGASATAIGAFHSITYFRPKGGEPVNLIMVVLVLAIAQVIAFVAIQTQPTTDELALAAAHELPRYREQHKLLSADQKDRWGILVNLKVNKNSLGLAIAILTLLILITFVVIPGIILLISPELMDLYGLWLVLMFVAITFCALISDIFWATLWVWIPSVFSLAAAIVVVTTYAWIAVDIATQPEIIGQDISSEKVTFSLVVAFFLTFGLLWPLMLVCYPASPGWRKAVMVFSYPIHVMRHRQLFSSSRVRRRAIAERRKRELSVTEPLVSGTSRTVRRDETSQGIAVRQNVCDHHPLTGRSSSQLAVVIARLRSGLDWVENKTGK